MYIIYNLEQQKTPKSKWINVMYKTWTQYVKNDCDEAQENERNQEWRRLMCSVVIHIYLY